MDPKAFVPLWVVDFPLLEWDEESKRFHAMHHPFTSPKTEDRKLMTRAPTTLFASGQSMLTDAFGGGLMLQSDQLGPIQMTSVATDLNYRIKVSEASKLALGLRLGMSNYNEALTDLYVMDPNDPIFQSDINQWNPMVGYGAMVYGDRYYLSFSSPGILRTAQHFCASGGFALPVQADWDFRFSSQYKIVTNAPGSLDLSPALAGSVARDRCFISYLVPRGLLRRKSSLMSSHHGRGPRNCFRFFLLPSSSKNCRSSLKHNNKPSSLSHHRGDC